MSTLQVNPQAKCFVPMYTTYDNVKILLVNKVQFQADPDVILDGELPNLLLGQLISRAETRVEMDLCGRYMVPFQSIRTGRFVDLPDHSRRSIQTAVDLRSVVEVLMTDFGRGTHISGAAYFKESTDAYDEYITLLLGRNKEGANSKHDRFRFSPPLKDVRLAISNQKADDGFRGRVINTDGSRHGAETYAEEQVNNPAATYIDRRIDIAEWPL